MIKFEKNLSSTSPFSFKFINQRTVKAIGILAPGFSDYVLSKSDVIKAIKSYIGRIHLFSDKSIRGEGLNFVAFKMHDLVPYFYTLLNLLLSVSSNSEIYRRFLPELKITRFCHLPFEEQIIVPAELPKLEVECSYIRAAGSKNYQYVALINPYHPIAYDSIEELRDKLQFLFPLKRVVLMVVGK